MREELETSIADIFREAWDVVSTRTVPNPEDLRLSNHAKELEEATVLYADLDGSTAMVDAYPGNLAQRYINLFTLRSKINQT